MRGTAAGNRGGMWILESGDLGDAKHHETAQLVKSIVKLDRFARVLPARRFHIEDVQQQRSHIVGMAGWGMCDAAARKNAGWGSAASGATDKDSASHLIPLQKQMKTATGSCKADLRSLTAQAVPRLALLAPGRRLLTSVSEGVDRGILLEAPEPLSAIPPRPSASSRPPPASSWFHASRIAL